MATITIRNLDEKVKRALQVRAALNGRSMEAEARDFLGGIIPADHDQPSREVDLGTAIHRRFAALGGVDLEIPPRTSSASATNESDPNRSEHPRLKKGLGTAIHDLFAPLGGVELQIPARRKSHRPVPTFEP